MFLLQWGWRTRGFHGERKKALLRRYAVTCVCVHVWPNMARVTPGAHVCTCSVVSGCTQTVQVFWGQTGEVLTNLWNHHHHHLCCTQTKLSKLEIWSWHSVNILLLLQQQFKQKVRSKKLRPVKPDEWRNAEKESNQQGRNKSCTKKKLKYPRKSKNMRIRTKSQKADKDLKKI